MRLQRFQAIVLRLSNQMFVRHYLWLNYPNDPQRMAIAFSEPTSERLEKELKSYGFRRNCLHAYLTLWEIYRTPDEPVDKPVEIEQNSTVPKP